MSKMRKRGRAAKAGAGSASSSGTALPSTDPEELLNLHSRLLNQTTKTIVESEVRSKECVFESTSQADNSWFDQLFAISTDTFDTMPSCFNELLIIGNEIKSSKQRKRLLREQMAKSGSDDEMMTKSQSRVSGVKRGFSEMSDTSMIDTDAIDSEMDGPNTRRRRRIHNDILDVSDDDDMDMDGYEMPDMADFNSESMNENGPTSSKIKSMGSRRRRKLKQLPKDFVDKYQTDIDMADVIGDGSIVDEANDTIGLADAGGASQMSTSLLDPLLQSGIDTRFETSYALPRSVGQINATDSSINRNVSSDKEAMSEIEASTITNTRDEVLHYLNCSLLESSLESSMKENYGEDWHVSMHGLHLCELAFITQFKNILSEACHKKMVSTMYGHISNQDLFTEQIREETLLDWIYHQNDEFDKKEEKENEEIAVDDLASEKANLRFKSLTGSLTREEQTRKDELKHQLTELQSNFSLAALGGDFSFDFGGGSSSSSSRSSQLKKKEKSDLYSNAKVRREQRQKSVSEKDILSAIRCSDRLSKLFPCSRVFEN